MKEILNQDQITRSLRRLTHEIIERSSNLDDIVIVGIKTKGDYVAKLIHSNLEQFTNKSILLYSLDVTNYRDDLDIKTNITNSFDVNNKHVILVDDVLYTGRTARAAMDALIDLGRFKKLELAVLVDRGHRELPIRADYVAKNVPTSKNESILLDFENLTLYIKEVDANDN